MKEIKERIMGHTERKQIIIMQKKISEDKHLKALRKMGDEPNVALKVEYDYVLER